MKIVAYSFTHSGSKIGEKLSNIDTLDIEHIENKGLKGGVKEHLQENYKYYDAIVFISATGIAIRMMLPYIKHKTKDAAIVVVDDKGKFSISLLSGHIGGANKIAKIVGESIEAIPVITTASEARGFKAIDDFTKENGYYIENRKYLTKIMAMMVNGDKIGLISKEDIDLDYTNLKKIENLKNLKDIKALIIIDKDMETVSMSIPYICLKSKDINIGIGCKKGMETLRIIEAIEKELKHLNISASRIKAIGTVEVKKDEKAIIEVARHFKSPLKIFSLEEINKVEDMFQKSDFVKKTIGVYSVSEPSAFLLGGNLIVRKAKHNGITISISKE